jgi:hypothetical protein
VDSRAASVEPAGYNRTVSTPASRQTRSRSRTMSSVPISVVASTISSVTREAAPSRSPACHRSRTAAATSAQPCRLYASL